MPGPVNSIMRTSVQSTSAAISWNEPEYVPFNYPISKYEVGFYKIGQECPNNVPQLTDGLLEIETVISSQDTVTFTGLTPNTCYVLAVRAFTEVGSGEWRGILVMTISPPPPPTTESTLTTTAITLSTMESPTVTPKAEMPTSFPGKNILKCNYMYMAYYTPPGMH